MLSLLGLLGAFLGYVPLLLAVEAPSFLSKAPPFFDGDSVNVHGIRVSCLSSSGISEGLLPSIVSLGLPPSMEYGLHFHIGGMLISGCVLPTVHG